MSLADLVKFAAKRTAHAEACARYREKNLEACRARVRASKLKAKQARAGARSGQS